MASTTTELLRSLAAKLKKTTTSVLQDISGLRAQIAQRKTALRIARHAPWPREDVPVLAREEVSRVAAVWLADGGRALAYRLTRVDRSPGATSSFSVGEPVPWGLFCLADPERAEAALVAAAERSALASGPPKAERAAVVARLEAELQELERIEEQATDDARAAGLDLAVRDDVRQRREAEARRQELEAEAVARRAEREAALNQRHRAASSYLER